jgi:hypothetical protein
VLLIGCHSIPRPCFVIEGDFSCALLEPENQWTQNLVAAHEVVGVVDELLMNPVNFHIDDPNRLINRRSD